MPNISFEERKELDKKSAEKREHFRTSIKISADDFKRIIRNCQEGAYTNGRLLEEYNRNKKQAD